MSDVLHPLGALTRLDLLAASTASALSGWADAATTSLVGQAQVVEIDPDLADTAAFCERYGVALADSANCVIVASRRGGDTTLAACVVLATTRADVNGLVRRHLAARKVSFAPMETAVSGSAMEYGGITPVGLPADWPVLVDRAVVEHPRVLIGSGLRRSKLWVPGALLAALPGAQVLDGLGQPSPSPEGRAAQAAQAALPPERQPPEK
ncbi:YbaK/aminoacyl-tRNA synthetase-associated domain-containing protein [Frankia sp. AiPs1]|uniref:YbaK/EbsC family protein n=1 Tax=Frankia sp. AiPa1 TaxID=573492 RepID=UPI00202B539D|nr:YbaK/EbsC family protein [Frankia sp. AiPa1]MCL9759201.1 YbaK/EbsC family protein [Frankia sp. AiPa1]